MRRGRKKVEHPETARRILAAAERHFAAQGLAGARTDEIAAAAHANKAMLYYYYGDKQRLHRAVLVNLLRQLRDVVYARPSRDVPPKERLLAYVSGYFDFLASHPNYPRLVQRESMEGKRNFEWIVSEYLRPFHLRLSKTIEEGIAAGEFRRVDPHHTVFIILGMTTSYFAVAPILSQIAGYDVMKPQAIAARKRVLLDFITNGLCRPGRRTR